MQGKSPPPCARFYLCVLRAIKLSLPTPDLQSSDFFWGFLLHICPCLSLPLKHGTFLNSIAPSRFCPHSAEVCDIFWAPFCLSLPSSAYCNLVSVHPTPILPNPVNALWLYFTYSWRGIWNCWSLVPPPWSSSSPHLTLLFFALVMLLSAFSSSLSVFLKLPIISPESLSFADTGFNHQIHRKSPAQISILSSRLLNLVAYQPYPPSFPRKENVQRNLSFLPISLYESHHMAPLHYSPNPALLPSNRSPYLLTDFF